MDWKSFNFLVTLQACQRFCGLKAGLPGHLLSLASRWRGKQRHRVTTGCPLVLKLELEAFFLWREAAGAWLILCTHPGMCALSLSGKSLAEPGAAGVGLLLKDTAAIPLCSAVAYSLQC